MSERSERVTSMLEALAAEFIRNESNPDPIITVTHASVSPDFRQATIFVTVYPNEREQDALNFLKRKGSDFRTFTKTRSSMKTLPFFEFAIDEGERARQRLDEIARDIKKEE